MVADIEPMKKPLCNKYTIDPGPIYRFILWHYHPSRLRCTCSVTWPSPDNSTSTPCQPYTTIPVLPNSCRSYSIFIGNNMLWIATDVWLLGTLRYHSYLFVVVSQSYETPLKDLRKFNSIINFFKFIFAPSNVIRMTLKISRGKIVFTPVTNATTLVMDRVNQTFDSLRKLKLMIDRADRVTDEADIRGELFKQSFTLAKVRLICFSGFIRSIYFLSNIKKIVWNIS